MTPEQVQATGELAEALEPSALALAHGLHEGISEAQYHRRVLGMANKGGLELALKAPAAYYAWATSTVADEPTPAMLFGKLFHMALLEPALYAAQPKPTTARGRADAETIYAMVRAVQQHPLAWALVGRGRAEVTARWRDATTGIECKARGDVWVPELATLADVKSTTDASPEAFARTVENFGYHRQQAFYEDGWAAVGQPTEHFAFIAVEKSAPYLIGVYQLDEAAVYIGRRQVRRGLGLLASCNARGEWPGLPQHITEISLPRWAKE